MANKPITEPRWFGQPYTAEHAATFGHSDFGPSKTKQSEADSCNINLILERYGPEIPPPDTEGLFQDFSTLESFQEAHNIVAHAKEQFMALDPRVRGRFDNDPARFLAFMEDPNNADEMVSLGLATRKPDPEPTPAATPAPDPKAKRKPLPPPSGGDDE